MLNSFFWLPGETGSEIAARLKRDLLPTMLSGIMYWPICDFITFRFIPVHLQVRVYFLVSYSCMHAMKIMFGSCMRWCNMCYTINSPKDFHSTFCCWLMIFCIVSFWQPLVSNSFSYLWTVYITYMASLEKATWSLSISNANFCFMIEIGSKLWDRVKTFGCLQGVLISRCPWLCYWPGHSVLSIFLTCIPLYLLL